jgi:hypothetical protein
MPPPKDDLHGFSWQMDDCDITFMITMIAKQKGFICIECMNKKDELYNVPTLQQKVLLYAK